jgi:hypothetical protein
VQFICPDGYKNEILPGLKIKNSEKNPKNMKIFVLTCALNGRSWVPETNHILLQKRKETATINIELTTFC